jgi:hypothetical protein
VVVEHAAKILPSLEDVFVSLIEAEDRTVQAENGRRPTTP